MARRTFYDVSCPDKEHKVRVGGVVLKFGRDGLLSDPRADQVAVMEADPYLRQRFVEGQPPRSPQKQTKAVEKPAGGVAATPPTPPAGENAVPREDPKGDEGK